ncbi:hypothetical protein Barb4_00146 [Bacteroidales bacterium Barb4]|nr:hypothetical protein Barb4_00146 [Bacteroidales bacterium Barb4]
MLIVRHPVSLSGKNHRVNITVFQVQRELVTNCDRFFPFFSDNRCYADAPKGQKISAPHAA